MKKPDFGDIVEVAIILVVLAVGFFYTAYELFDTSSVSGSHNRYYEARQSVRILFKMGSDFFKQTPLI